jgi:hypothetical protein
MRQKQVDSLQDKLKDLERDMSKLRDDDTPLTRNIRYKLGILKTRGTNIEKHWYKKNCSHLNLQDSSRTSNSDVCVCVCVYIYMCECVSLGVCV